MQRQPIARCLRDAGDGGRIVEVAPGGRVGQKKMVAYEVDQHGHIGGREPHPRGDTVDYLHADGGVIARVTLSDVVQKGADQEQVGPLDGVGELGGERGSFQ